MERSSIKKDEAKSDNIPLGRAKKEEAKSDNIPLGRAKKEEVIRDGDGEFRNAEFEDLVFCWNGDGDILQEASGRGEGGSAAKQLHDTRQLCRLKDIVCLLLSYSISFKGTDRISHWIQKVLWLIKHCRLKFIDRLASGEFLSIDSAEFNLPPYAPEGIEFYLPYWFPSQSEESGDTESLGATMELVDLAVDSAIVQLKKCFSKEMEENIRLIAISGEGAKKVTSSLKDLAFIKDMFDLVLSVTISENENLCDLEKVIDQQWVDFPRRNIILLLDDFDDMITLSEWLLLLDLEIRMEDHLVPWSVFSRNVGQILHTSTTIQSIAASVIKKCQGCLPAIIILARALRGIADPDVWEDALYHMHSPVADCTTTTTHEAIMINALKLARALGGIAGPDVWEDAGYPDVWEDAGYPYVWEDAGYHMHSPVAGGATTTHHEAIMINALKFSLSRKNRVTRQYLKNCIHNVNESIVSPPGLISEEGDCIENDLVDAFLLHRSEDGEGLTMEEEIRQILLRTSLLDVCEMIGDGESNALEIQLVNIDISQLPQSPSCPMLTGLFLQMNSDLTLLPSSFFRYMACLQILNVSNTSISSLPESLFQLYALEKLYLKDCELFTELPSKIQELKNLKELDLEGTALLNLPKEVGDLEKLTCLKVSFHGDLGLDGECPSETMIPAGILSKLSMLMNLCIDVDPADRRWDEAVKVIIGELSYLKQLKSLEMYLPEVTLLDELRMSLPSFIHDSATKFRLTVGRHQRRIISRVPLGIECQFGNSNKCLKYVNGNELNSNISAQVIDVLKHCDSFFLNRHFTITELAKLGIENMEKLKFCVLGENDELLTIMSTYALPPLLENLIIYRMKNMRSIVEGPFETGRLCFLKSLILNGCPRLKVVFTPELLASIWGLEELIVEDRPDISCLLSGVMNYWEHIRCHERLKNLSLHHLPELESIFGSQSIEPLALRVSIYDCPKLRSLFKVPGSLKVIRGENHWFNALQWEDQSSKHNASRVFVPIRNGSHFKTQLAADGFNV